MTLFELGEIERKIQEFLKSYEYRNNIGDFDKDNEYQYDLIFSTDNRICCGFSEDFQSDPRNVYMKLKEVLPSM